MKFSPYFLSRLLSALALASAATAHAQTIPISSYSYLAGPSGSYADNGSELTDGIAVVQAWPDTSGLDVQPLVGWQNSEGRIRFNFDGVVTIRSATFHFADSNSSAGVYFPSAISLTNASATFLQEFTLADPAGSGTTVGATVGDFEIITDHLILVMPNIPGEQWHMISEASFSATAIPEPSTYAMLAGSLALGLAIARSRRRTRD